MGGLGGPGVDQKWTNMVPFRRSTSDFWTAFSSRGPPSVRTYPTFGPLQ